MRQKERGKTNEQTEQDEAKKREIKSVRVPYGGCGVRDVGGARHDEEVRVG